MMGHDYASESGLSLVDLAALCNIVVPMAHYSALDYRKESEQNVYWLTSRKE